MHAITKMANLTKFRQRYRLERVSSREGYQQSGDFDESGGFYENDEFDETSPKINIRANELERKVPTKW